MDTSAACGAAASTSGPADSKLRTKLDGGAGALLTRLQSHPSVFKHKKSHVQDLKAKPVFLEFRRVGTHWS